MKKLIPILVLLLLIITVSAQEEINSSKAIEDDLYEKEFTEIVEEDIYEDIGDVKLEGKAGITPDSSFYFLESLVESIFVGDNPETALKYKEEKILEVEEMIKSGNNEAAEKALEKVEKYNEILKKEVTPDLDKRVRESSKATKELLGSLELEGDEWKDVKGIIDENLKTEDKIALAAKISNKIKELCETLSDIDPLEYSKLCKTDDNAPEWQKKLDKELTEEQKKEAKNFGKIMSECFKTSGKECNCEEIPFPEFAEVCSVAAPLAIACDINGDEESCNRLDNLDMPELPDHLHSPPVKSHLPCFALHSFAHSLSRFFISS